MNTPVSLLLIGCKQVQGGRGGVRGLTALVTGVETPQQQVNTTLSLLSRSLPHYYYLITIISLLIRLNYPLTFNHHYYFISPVQRGTHRSGTQRSGSRRRGRRDGHRSSSCCVDLAMVSMGAKCASARSSRGGCSRIGGNATPPAPPQPLDTTDKKTMYIHTD